MTEHAFRTTHIILPAFNEEESLPSLLERLGNLNQSMEGKLLVWVVDDGSTDGTGDIASKGVTGLDVKLVQHSRNMGLGQALNSGIRAVLEVAGDNDIAIVMDADDTHDVRLIPTMLERIDLGADIALASRYVSGGSDATAPAYRRLLSRGAAFVFRSLLPLKGIHDFTSGYRAYRVSLLRRATSHWGERIIEERGFACMVELMLKLRHCDPRIDEVPMVLRYDRKRGGSKLRIFPTLMQYLKLAIRDRLTPPPFRNI